MRATARLFAVCCLALSGCGFVQGTAIRVLDPVLEKAGENAESETDPQLVEDGLPGTILLVEGILASKPDDQTLRILAARSATGYALAFVEDVDRKRASNFYLRARAHAFHVLDLKRGKFAAARDGTLAQFTAVVDEFGKNDVPALFWAANSWGAWVNLNLDKTEALADLPRVEALMQRVVELDPEYYHGGPHLFFGVYYAGRSKLLGGNPEKAEYHFREAFRITDNKFLLAHVMYAQYYARQQFDEELFKNKLEWVLDQPEGIYPSAGLTNAVARRKAEHLLTLTEDWF